MNRIEMKLQLLDKLKELMMATDGERMAPESVEVEIETPDGDEMHADIGEEKKGSLEDTLDEAQANADEDCEEVAEDLEEHEEDPEAHDKKKKGFREFFGR